MREVAEDEHERDAEHVLPTTQTDGQKMMTAHPPKSVVSLWGPGARRALHLPSFEG
jgi:hypothetical protein